MSVPLRKRTVTRPLPFDERDETLSHPVTVDSAPSIRDVTLCSIRRAEASGQVKETSIFRSAGDGVYWMLSIGSTATPMTVSAAMMSSTEKAGMPRRIRGESELLFIGDACRFHSKPAV